MTGAGETPTQPDARGSGRPRKASPVAIVLAAVGFGLAAFMFFTDDDSPAESAATTSPTTTTAGISSSTTANGPSSSEAPPATDPLPTSAAPAATSSLIAFEGIGGMGPGDGLSESEVDSEFPPCGYWDFGNIFGTATLTGGSWEVVDVRTRSSAYRSPSAIGVGTDLATLERVYGSDLVVDRADGWDAPTAGLLGSYSDVAAIRDDSRAITYTLTDDLVSEVKVGSAEFWGDDEGCV